MYCLPKANYFGGGREGHHQITLTVECSKSQTLSPKPLVSAEKASLLGHSLMPCNAVTEVGVMLMAVDRNPGPWGLKGLRFRVEPEPLTLCCALGTELVNQIAVLGILEQL